MDVTLFAEERAVESTALQPALQSECSRIGAALRRQLTLSVTRG